MSVKNQKIILIIAFFVTASIVVMAYWFQTEYGIFYSRERRVEISEKLEEKSRDFMEKTFPADFPQSEKLAKRSIRYNKKNIDSYILLARSFYAQEKLEKARDTYLAGLKIDPENFKMNFYLANIYRDLGEFDLAEKYYQKALEIEPQNIDCWINYAIFYSFDKKDWKGAVKIYEEALKINPEDQRLKNLLEMAKKEGEREENF